MGTCMTVGKCDLNQVMGAKKMSAAETELREHCRMGHRSKLKLQAPGFVCHGCVTGGMQELRARSGGATKNRGHDELGGDTVDYKTEDVNGHRYGSHWVTLKGHLGKLRMLKHKTASSSATAFTSIKRELEALADPGAVHGYKVR